MPKKSEHALALFHAHVGIEIWKHVHDFPFVEVSNCCVNNLEWVTCSENILHSYKHRKV